MKFCPQCGTPFEPDARFCLECGFDRLTVETINAEPVPVVENTDSAPDKLLCPQCGTELVPRERFCLECGFDNLSVVTAAPEAEPEVPAETFLPPVIPEEPVTPAEVLRSCPKCGTGIGITDQFCDSCGFDTAAAEPEPLVKNPEPVVVEEIIIPQIPVEEPVPLAVSKQFCPRCGSVIAPDDRFCDECGFDTSAPVVEPVLAAPPIAPTPQPKPVIPPVYQSAPAAPAYSPPSVPKIAQPALKKKKTWLLVLITVLFLGVLGAGAWFGYTKFISSNTGDDEDSITNTVIPETPAIDTSSIATNPVSTETATPEKPAPSTKPLSLMDKELAKYKNKQQKPQQQPAIATTSPSQPAANETGMKITSSLAIDESQVKTIMEVGRKEDPKHKNPKNPAKLVLVKNTMIVRITTDHYNDGMGTKGGGTITIKDKNDYLIGNYRASTKAGANGAPSAKWIIEPRKILEKGTYLIYDSDFSTWSKTLLGSGFIEVEGYEVK